MKQKGFTLIEMIAVVMIIALIALISLPTITNQLVEKKDDISDTTLKIIYNAAELYMSNRPTEFPKIRGEEYCISLDTLVGSGNLSSPIKDYNTGNEIPLTKYIKIEINGYLEYDNFELVDENC